MCNTPGDNNAIVLYPHNSLRKIEVIICNHHACSLLYSLPDADVCAYVWIVLHVCHCTHERTNKISCILYLVSCLSGDWQARKRVWPYMTLTSSLRTSVIKHHSFYPSSKYHLKNKSDFLWLLLLGCYGSYKFKWPLSRCNMMCSYRLRSHGHELDENLFRDSRRYW